MSLTPEERNLSEFSIKYTPYSIQDHFQSNVFTKCKSKDCFKNYYHYAYGKR